MSIFIYTHFYCMSIFIYTHQEHAILKKNTGFKRSLRNGKEVCVFGFFCVFKKQKFEKLVTRIWKNLRISKKIHGFRKSSWIWITICISKKFVNLKDVQEFDCFSYFEKVHEFEKRRTEKWKRKTAPEKTCGTFYPWDEKNKNRCERGQTLFGALSARYRVNGTGRTPPCPRCAGPQSFLSALKTQKRRACITRIKLRISWTYLHCINQPAICTWRV